MKTIYLKRMLLLAFFCLVLAGFQAENAYARPKAPQVEQSGNSIDVYWNEVKDAQYYRVECYKASAPDTVYTYDETSYTSTWFYGFEGGYDYEFVVKAYNEDGKRISTSDRASLAVKIPAPYVYDVTAGSISATIRWDAYNCPGYKIYRSEDGKNWECIKTIKNIKKYEGYDSYYGEAGYVDIVPNTNQSYYYKVAGYDAKADYKYGIRSSSEYVYVEPMKEEITVLPNQSKSLRINWKEDPGVSGYRIYRASEKDGSYKSIKTITDDAQTSYVDGGKTLGKVYYYKVRSFVDDADGKRSYSPYSDIVSCKVKLGTPSITSITASTTTKAVIKWKKTTDADGYMIYRSKSYDSGYKKVKTIEDGSTTSYTLGGQVNGECYYYKIRAYKTVNGEKLYSNYCDIVEKYHDRYGYRGESWDSRNKRCFGSGSSSYSSQSQAEKHMTTIKVKVWMLDSNNKKFTTTRSLTVNEGLADTVKKIFQEIYEGDEKFPIKDVGGYEWRGDNSTSEHCEGTAIDINSDENYMINKNTGEILAGSLYKPGKNPYSIPADGDVVRAFEKYGFYWGDWSTKRDYMHFSYFGT